MDHGLSGLKLCICNFSVMPITPKALTAGLFFKAALRRLSFAGDGFAAAVTGELQFTTFSGVRGVGDAAGVVTLSGFARPHMALVRFRSSVFALER